MEALQRLIDLLDAPGAEVPPDLIEELDRVAPALGVGAALALRRNVGMDIEQRRSLAAKVALMASDPVAFYALTRPEADNSDEPLYPDDTPAAPDTDDAIVTFLETYGHGTSPREDALVERLIFNPQPDYATVLEQNFEAVEEPYDSQTEAIDSFLSKHQPPKPVTVETQEQISVTPRSTPHHSATRRKATAKAVDSEAPLAGSLATVYIRQGRYERAYEILSQINLNNSEKSAYFADQIRFLRKLMLATGRHQPVGSQ